jgi:predicted transcriptional regulator
MQKCRCNVLPVVSSGQVVGVISLRDIESLMREYSMGKVLEQAYTVSHYMKGPVKPAPNSEDLAAVINTLLEDNVQAVFMKKNESIVGILTRDHLLEFLAELSKKNHTTLKDTLEFLHH